MGWWSTVSVLLNWEHRVCSLNDLLINRMHPAVILLFVNTRSNLKGLTARIIHSQRQLKQKLRKLLNRPRDSGSKHSIDLTRESLLSILYLPLSLPLCIDYFWMNKLFFFWFVLNRCKLCQVPSLVCLSNHQGTQSECVNLCLYIWSQFETDKISQTDLDR